MRALGYVRVSTDRQADSGASFEAQAAAIRHACAQRGWELLSIATDTQTGATIRRAGVRQALALLDAGEADVLVAAKLDRLSRSLVDYASLVERARRKGWQLVVLDAPVGTDTPMGEAMLGIMAVFAQLERRLISERTKDALAVKKAAGVVLGKPRLVAPATEARIRALHAEGQTLRRIIATLEAEGHTPPGGRQWHASTVKRILDYGKASA